jgi:hypothetical protein
MNELNSEFKCEWCGSKTEYKIQGSCQGSFCTNPSCTWSVVTTYLPEFARDKTLYKMYLVSIDSASKNQIQFLSKVLNCNFIEAKRFLESNESYLGEGLATEALKTNKLAIECGVGINFEPECIHLKC